MPVYVFLLLIIFYSFGDTLETFLSAVIINVLMLMIIFNNTLNTFLSMFIVMSDMFNARLKISKHSSKEGNVLFNEVHILIRLYGSGHMVKDHLDTQRKPAPATTWATLFD